MQKQVVDLVHLVATDVGMKAMLLMSVMKSRAARQEAEQKKAMRVTDESHEFILDEILRREKEPLAAHGKLIVIGCTVFQLQDIGTQSLCRSRWLIWCMWLQLMWK